MLYTVLKLAACQSCLGTCENILMFRPPQDKELDGGGDSRNQAWAFS